MEVLTHSKRQSFKACRRAFFYRHELHLRPRVDRPGRRRGHAFAAALASGGRWEEIAEAIETAYVEQLPSSQEESDELEFEKHALVVLASEYLDRYGAVPRREMEYELPLINPATGHSSRAFRRGGKVDGVVTVGRKRVRIIEDKLYQQVTLETIQSLPLDEQTCEYVDAFAQKGWTAEVEYRHTRWPSIRRKQSESLDDFCERFTQDIAGRPSFYFDRQVFDFPEELLADFREERWQTAQDILSARRLFRRSGSLSVWYKNPARCDIYGAGCQFTPLCTCQPDAENLYVIEVDNPELGEGRNANQDGTKARAAAAVEA